MEEGKFKTEEVYELLKKRIIHLEYEPGQILNEVDLAQEFHISRTPIRKVFHTLKNDKLLNIIPRFGAQVVPIDFKEMKSVFELTRELDPFATRLAVERISEEQIEELQKIIYRLNNYDITIDYQEAIIDDEKFHKIIHASCNNQWLEDILLFLHYHTERLWHYCEKNFDSMDLFSNSLGLILEAVKEKNSVKAEKYARQHIDEFILKIKEELL